MEETLFVVMPAYNEIENIETVVSQWYPIIEDKNDESRLVIADNGSNDGTHELLEKIRKTKPKLTILSDTGKFHGPKVIALYKYAIENGADYVFQTDSDGQTNPDEFEAFWDERRDYDGLIGYRAVREDGKGRAFVEKVVCFLVFVFFGVRVPDANAPFRLMKTSLISKYIDLLSEDFNIPNIMFTAFFAYHKEKICFKEITFRPRQGGKNSINIGKIIKIGFKALKDFKMLSKKCKQAG